MQRLRVCESNLSSNSLSNLFKTPLLVEFKAPASTLSWCDRHTLVKVGRRLQIIPRLLLQLLTELLPLYRSYVSCTERGKWFVSQKNQKKITCGYRCYETQYIPLSVGIRCVSSISLPLASTVRPLSSRIRGVGLFTSLISTFLQLNKQRNPFIFTVPFEERYTAPSVFCSVYVSNILCFDVTYGGAIPMACRLASATKL